MERTNLSNSNDMTLRNCIPIANVPRAISRAKLNATQPLVGAAMEIEEPGDDLAVAALELALRDGEEGEILDEDIVESAAPRVEASNPIKYPTKWVTADSHELILKAMGKAPNMVCNLCGATATSRKRIRLHARLHYVHSFCKWGYASKWRESIRTHQKDTRNASSDQSVHPVYEVDAASFASWRRTLNVAVDSYPGEAPTRVITCSQQPAATSSPSTSTVTASAPSTSGTRAGPARGVHRVDSSSTHASASTTASSRGRKHYSGSKSAKNRSSTDNSCPRTESRPRQPSPTRPDARQVIQKSQDNRRRASPTRHSTPARADRSSTTSHFTACTRDYRYASTAPATKPPSTTTIRPFHSDGSARWEEALTGQKRPRSPPPTRRSNEPQPPPAVRPIQSPPSESAAMRDMRRLVRRTEDRFAQLLRIIREQEDDLRDMNRAMKRQKRDKDDDRRK